MKHVVSREIKLKMGEKMKNWREKKTLKTRKTKKTQEQCKHTIILTKEKSIFIDSTAHKWAHFLLLTNCIILTNYLNDVVAFPPPSSHAQNHWWKIQVRKPITYTHSNSFLYVNNILLI